MKAILSVYNKDNIVEFAKALTERGIELIATEGTAAEILTNGIGVTKVSEFTGFHEMLDGRIKTLHPRIHAGITTGEIGIVAVNLIPFDTSSKDPLATMDLGGVALLRTAIKNFEHAAAVVNPSSYNAIIEELTKDGELSHDTKLDLAREASEYILAYDSKIDMVLKRMK
jgi:phosphoribosylaminoimidazolecarboxamide formyltransferase/IMP cyclohydrolase